MVRRVVHFAILLIEKYRYGERFFHFKVKIFHHTENPPSAYKQLSSNRATSQEAKPRV
jgi:hypothetical protein